MATKAKKLPSGTWRSVANLGKGPDGKPLRKSFSAPTKKEAENAAAAAERDYEAFRSNPNLNMTLDEAWTRFMRLKEPVLSPATLRNYKSKKGIFQSLMPLKLHAFDSVTMQEIISGLSVKYKPSTVHNAYGCLVSVIKMFNPEYHVKAQLPKEASREITIPEASYIQALICESYRMKNNDMALAYTIASQLGLRSGEICALTFADVADGYVRINKSMVKTKDLTWVIKSPKTKDSSRTLKQTPAVSDCLRNFHGAPSDRIVSMTPATCTTMNAYLQRKLHIPHFRFHDLRHYNASVMVSMNIPLMYVARRLGHADTKMVEQVYGHLMHDKMDEIDKQVDAYFG